jgi:hypothetical protein
MPISIAIQPHPAPGVVHVVLSGPWPRPDEQRALAQLMSAEPMARFERRLLVDARQLATLPFLDDLRGTMSIISGFSGSCRLAIVVGSEVQFGVARMVELLLPAGFETLVTTDDDTAAAWLAGMRWGAPATEPQVIPQS